jgi:SprT protein
MDLKELHEIASQEMTKHGLHDWSFRLGDTKRRLGVCKYRAKRIEIAAYFALNSPREAVLDTLLHEIAHALAGPAAHHGPVWKAVAVRLGARPRACKTSHEAVVKPGDWQARCPACQQTFHLYKRPRSLTGYHCKCAARSPLVFEFAGDPARKPFVPMIAEKSANWEAKCAGCQKVHFRLRRPKPVVYLCRCPQGCELTWQFRPQRIPHD